MGMNLLKNDTHVDGHFSSKSMALPSGTLTNAMLNASAGIAATKLEHQFALPYAQVPGTAVVAATQDIHIVQGTTGELVAIEAAITGVIATGADRTVTVDLHKSTAGGAFATVLSATIVLDDDSVIRIAEAGTINAPDLVSGDILRLIVTVAGAAGNQGQGMIVTTTLREDPT